MCPLHETLGCIIVPVPQLHRSLLEIAIKPRLAVSRRRLWQLKNPEAPYQVSAISRRVTNYRVDYTRHARNSLFALVKSFVLAI
ncbi:hypothetical protein VTK73DRAFT_8614 [Phialemonium thermophilum]|uniref:Uncharacterized protein n=1 Tax=Phialemonium thermophilum TaxID=223376 RepID=A0ABR3XPC1_9PEZI